MATIVFYACIWVPFLQLKKAFAMTMGFVFFTSPPVESFTQESVMLWKEKEVAQSFCLLSTLEIFPGRKRVGEVSFHVRGTGKRKTKRYKKKRLGQMLVGSVKLGH